MRQLIGIIGGLLGSEAIIAPRNEIVADYPKPGRQGKPAKGKRAASKRSRANRRKS